ncbi:MAG TPA: DNA polymerase III subunit epsilon, partial [Erythrobacter sp.]|nr:DNA polymerase III subunit epsilon [Erythrobacter sp.]
LVENISDAAAILSTTTNAPWHRPPSDKPRRDPRPHMASPEELARHRAFIAGIDNAIWDR